MVKNQITLGATPVGPGNQGPLVDVLTWFLMCLIILSVLMRLVIQRFLGRQRWREDVTVCVAAAFGIAQSIATSIEVSHGLGKYQDTLSDAQVGSIFRAQYAADIFFLPTLCLAEIGTLQLIEWLAASDAHRRVARWLIYFTIAWSVPCAIIMIFHGGFPHPWAQGGSTVSMYALWNAISVLAIVTEAALVALPISIIVPTQMTVSNKIMVLSAFCFRILVVAAIATRMAYLPSVRTSTPDASYALAHLAVATQVVLAMAINTACIPSLKPFLDAFETGMLEVSLYPRNGDSSLPIRSVNYELGSWGKGLTQTTATAKEGGHHPHNLRLDRRERSARGTARDRSLDSERASDEMVIVRTAEFEVHYDNVSQRGRGDSVPFADSP